jgi:hypothetical protein
LAGGPSYREAKGGDDCAEEMWGQTGRAAFLSATELKEKLVNVPSVPVPFDIRHVRVIYYDANDPFWGDKLIAKVAENVVSAISNPKEAIQFRDE